MKTKPRVPGRGWAYAGAVFGFTGSIAANVAHSYVPPDAAPAGWSPQTGAVFSAVFWPVALFLVVEIFARVAWPDGKRWTALRFLGTLPVAAVAAVVSYRHLSGLLAFYGDDPLTVALGPLAVDGLMVMATGALIATGNRRNPIGPLRYVLTDKGWVDKDGTQWHPPWDSPPSATDTASVVNDVPVSAAAAATAAPAQAPARARPSRSAPRRVNPRPASADKVAKAAARMPADATVAQIAARAGVSESTARRHLPKTATPAYGAVVASPTPPLPAETSVLADVAA